MTTFSLSFRPSPHRRAAPAAIFLTPPSVDPSTPRAARLEVELDFVRPTNLAFLVPLPPTSSSSLRLLP